MTTTAVAPVNGSSNGLDNEARALIVHPDSVGVAAEQQRVIAEIKAALTVAQAAPRNEIAAIDRIKTSCQRKGLAEHAEYVYSRGGQEIKGPTIDLMTVIANHWGNVKFGFRELSQKNGESTVECFAWDLETNSQRVVTITIPHKRYTKSGTYPLTDPRDIYELVANNAQRRVRSCLEAIIPPDVVSAAVDQCRQTLLASAEVTPQSIANMLEFFAKYGVTKEQVEKRLQRRMDAMQPAQLISLRQIANSLKAGMSRPDEWFEATPANNGDNGTPAKPASGTEAAKQAMRDKAAGAPSPAPTESAATGATANGETPPAPSQSPPAPAPAEQAPVAAPSAAEPAPKGRGGKITPDMKKKIGELSKGVPDEEMADLLNSFGCDAVRELTQVQAGELIDKLMARKA